MNKIENIIKENKAVTGITMWDEKNGKAVIRCLKEDEILVEDLINQLKNNGENISIVGVNGGFNNSEKKIIINF